MTKKNQTSSIELAEKEILMPEYYEYFDEIESAVTIKSKSAHTVRSYKYAIVDFLDNLNITGLEGIKTLTSKDIRQYRNSIIQTKKVSAATINTRFRAINAFLNWLHGNEYIEKNPMDNIKFLEEGERLDDYITDEEWDALIQGCETIEEKFLLVFMRSTGFRRSEVVNVKLTDIKDGYVYTIGKRNKEAKIRLPDNVIELMNEYLKDHKGEYLFISRRGNHQLTPESIRLRIRKIAENAGIDPERVKEIHPHIIRHTFITNLALNNEVKTVQSAARHSSPQTTLGYMHPVREAVDNATKNQKIKF